MNTHMRVNEFGSGCERKNSTRLRQDLLAMWLQETQKAVRILMIQHSSANGGNYCKVNYSKLHLGSCHSRPREKHSRLLSSVLLPRGWNTCFFKSLSSRKNNSKQFNGLLLKILKKSNILPTPQKTLIVTHYQQFITKWPVQNINCQVNCTKFR
jgi:hypothetical protein